MDKRKIIEEQITILSNLSRGIAQNEYATLANDGLYSLLPEIGETIAELVLWKRFDPEETGDQLKTGVLRACFGIGLPASMLLMLHYTFLEANQRNLFRLHASEHRALQDLEALVL